MAELTRAIREHRKEFVQCHRSSLTATQARLLASWPKRELAHVFGDNATLFQFPQSYWKEILPILLSGSISDANAAVLPFDILERLADVHIYIRPSWIWESLFVNDLQRKQRALILPLSPAPSPTFYLSSLLDKSFDSWGTVECKLLQRLLPWISILSYGDTRRNLFSYDVMTYIQSNPSLSRMFQSLPLLLDLSDIPVLTEQQYADIELWMKSRPNQQSIEPNSWLQHFYSPLSTTNDPELLLKL